MQSPDTHKDPQLEYALASLRSHGLRWAGMAVSALTIIIGAVMVFRGLEGSFNWAVEVPHSLGAKLTNASPGIVFATVGLLLGFAVVFQKPVNYDTGRGSILGKLNDGGVSLTSEEIAKVKKKRTPKRSGSNITLGG